MSPLVESLSEYCHDVWYGKTRMVWLPQGEKIEDTFIRSDRMYERDRRTDGQTYRKTDIAWRHRPRLCIASRSNYSEKHSPYMDNKNQYCKFYKGLLIMGIKRPCGGLSWLPVSCLLHVKYTVSYRIVSYNIGLNEYHCFEKVAWSIERHHFQWPSTAPNQYLRSRHYLMPNISEMEKDRPTTIVSTECE